MTISFILNGEDIIHTADSHESLLSVLQLHFSLLEDHSPCGKTYCQRCACLLDNRLVLACRIPFFQVRRREVVTLEGWKLTEDYRNLLRLTEESGIPRCPSCTDIRLFAAFHFPEAKMQVLMDEIPCRCGTGEAMARVLEDLKDRRGDQHVGKK
jgi:carbon-monoxide dehydrogenase small subunit